MLMMSNSHKLVLIVLTFFLALTFVRGFTVDVPSHSLELIPGVKVPYALTITNPSNDEATYSFEALGPFSIVISGDEEAATIPPHAYKTVTLLITADEGLETGDVFDSQIRVKNANEIESVMVKMTIISNPIFGVGNANDNQNDSTPGTGLVSFPSVSENLVNAGLIVIIIVLVIALLARIKNRVVG